MKLLTPFILFILYICIITIVIIIITIQCNNFKIETFEDKNDLVLINITKAYVLSMNSEKGRERIAGLYNNFKYYKLPEIEIFYGTSPNDFDEHTIDKFHPKNPLSKPQISNTKAMYDILVTIANGQHEWVYVFEDDARIVNVSENSDLSKMYVPADSEVIILSRGKDIVWENNTKLEYERVYGGGLAHATLYSKKSAQKLIKALLPLWNVFDIMLYKTSCDWKHEVGKYQTQDDLESHDTYTQNMGIQNKQTEPCVIMYSSIRIFDQTSNPTPPIRNDNNLEEIHKQIIDKHAGYAIHPNDWISTSSLV